MYMGIISIDLKHLFYMEGLFYDELFLVPVNII